ncbi:hydrogenase maturation peptidase HycI [Candidatus Woesearchaeota archaeon]|nr:hydrogenase maturation peptidase HycI [Candidatus Woesearchaeota archaeon]
MLYLLCFGNPYLENDNLAIRIADALIADQTPEIEIIKCISPEEVMHYTDKDFAILDVVKGLTEPRVIDDIGKLETGTMVSLHDFDLGFFLKLMKETGRLENIRIIGLPQKGDVAGLKEKVINLLKECSSLTSSGAGGRGLGRRDNDNPPANKHPISQRNLLVGVGNTTRSDDGIGPYIANLFQTSLPEGWHVIDAGPVPENFTTPIRNTNPDTIILVDSADMNLQPGDFRIIPPERLDSLHMTTHAMPLSTLISYFHKDIPQAKEIIFIGIQPKVLGPGEDISDELKKSAEEIISILKNKQLSSIKSLK